MSEDSQPALTVQTTLGKTRLAIQVSILSLLVFLAGYVILWADRHNDERYVTKADYARDRESDERLRTQINTGITWRMDQTDKKLEEISADIKALLRRQP